MEYSERFSEALAYADRMHRGQVRKGTEIPYISHLLAVASIVIENGGDEDEAISALLHDTIEDQGGERDVSAELRQWFGHDVAGIVEECTDADTLPKPPWKARKMKYIAHLHSASPSVCLVVVADKLHNACCILSDYRRMGDAVWGRFNTGREEQLWFYRAVHDALRGKAPGSLLDELSRILDELEVLIGQS